LRSLEALAEALDSRINSLVLANLSVRRPGDLKLDLNDLFYPDYGLVISGARTDSLGCLLQELRAHVTGADSDRQITSLVLHGPPGTGKTTMAEAVAKASGVPLVEITPSDILLGGVEKIETRARMVFESLALLTNAVILFDEFDPILWSRDAPEKPEGTLRFLTPGMLPKLKRLYEKAEKQHVAFILSTNLIGGLDKAATREGRFDEKCPVFPPDPLARFGRLSFEWSKWTKGRSPRISNRHSVFSQAIHRPSL
jgi:ATPase family protein associated with various cellular activities (AAA)